MNAEQMSKWRLGSYTLSALAEEPGAAAVEAEGITGETVVAIDPLGDCTSAILASASSACNAAAGLLAEAVGRLERDSLAGHTP